MKSYLYLFLMFFFCRNICNCATIIPVDLYSKSSSFILTGDYDNAKLLIDEYIKNYPEEPSGYLFKTLLIQYMTIDYEDYSQENVFFENIVSCEKYSKKRISLDDKDYWAKYYYYTAKTLKGLWNVSKGNWLSGFFESREGISGIENILSEKAICSDASITWGSYIFWKSVSVKKFKWLPYIKDRRKEGIDIVRNSIGKGVFTGDLSNTVLMEMLIEDKPSEAEKLGDILIEKYPDCRIFKWQLGEACKKQNKYDKCVDIYTDIASSMQKDKKDDGSGVLRCYWKLAVLSKDLKKNNECLRYCREVLKSGSNTVVYNRNKTRVENTKKIINELENGAE